MANLLLPKTMLNYRIINLEEEQGKKAAITKGISMAKGELIVTTDADCIMGKDWLKAITAHFENPKIQLVTGPVSYNRKSNWSACRTTAAVLRLVFHKSQIMKTIICICIGISK